MDPTVDSWLETVNMFLPEGCDISEDDLQARLNHHKIRVNDLQLDRPHLRGFKSLLNLKYGVRCCSTHGFTEPTFKRKLRNFPSGELLASWLLGVAPGPSEGGGLCGLWDVYTQEGGEMSEQNQDWRDVDKQPRLHLSIRVKTYEIAAVGDGSKVRVTCHSRGVRPRTTTPGHVTVADDRTRLDFNVHFCQPEALRALQRHSWLGVTLELKCAEDGYEYLEGISHMHWDGDGNEWTRREDNFDRGDTGYCRRIQFHRYQAFPRGGKSTGKAVPRAAGTH